ncbi:MAG: hypothetical protein COT85_01965 [Chlamydiae bacterium CG10_big_fil_rev_8_21_14_0_10_42_34]|nr:MAG: hypothetical protein COT85_01965 [Chlamydiae bacterium CG10_big_fil_rev_8_21_14_0_10_42_34]
MKKLIFIFFAFTLCAQEEEGSSLSLWDFHPIHAGGNVIAIGKANVDQKNGSRNGEVTFNKANAFLYMLVPIDHYSYFFPRVEYNAFDLDWNENPKFHETQFQYVQFALTFMSIAMEKWRWIARADYNIDVNHFNKARTYGLFSALLWGTHELHRKWHYHVGALGYTGFEGQEIYPVIGFDYSPNKKWMFQAVFPINYSIEYSLNKRWRFSLKGRPLKERFRTDKYQPQPRSVFSYSTMGAEFNVHYEQFLRVEAEIFAGYNFGGSMYVKNESGHNAIYTHVQGAPYIGANFNWGF